jgi:hypothetical protein
MDARRVGKRFGTEDANSAQSKKIQSINSGQTVLLYLKTPFINVEFP